jgi:hypothetical protein
LIFSLSSVDFLGIIQQPPRKRRNLFTGRSTGDSVEPKVKKAKCAEVRALFLEEDPENPGRKKYRHREIDMQLQVFSETGWPKSNLYTMRTSVSKGTKYRPFGGRPYLIPWEYLDKFGDLVVFLGLHKFEYQNELRLLYRHYMLSLEQEARTMCLKTMDRYLVALNIVERVAEKFATEARQKTESCIRTYVSIHFTQLVLLFCFTFILEFILCLN